VTQAAIELDAAEQRFGGVHALRSVSLAVPAGEIRGLIGPNGAGKTTLLNVLTGLQRPTRGRLRYFGQDVTGWPPYRIARRAGIVRTFQTVRLFATMNVFDNVRVALDARRPFPEERILRRPRRPAVSSTERTREVIADLGLEEVAASRVTQLSYGTRRRVEMARALVMSPRVLLLDEPAAGLNGAERAELGELLVDLRGRGLTIVLVDHQMDLVSSVCDRLTVLDFGRVICEGPPGEVIEDERVLEAYLGAPGGRL
jgi:ABC-type branched-subunit amino acid transport system ATPase component